LAVANIHTHPVDASPEQAEACLKLAEISAEDSSFADRVRALGVSDPLLDEGLAELAAVVDAAAAQAPGLVVADLKIARGLDYYTGTVYETELEGYEHLGSICSGGRYDTLASDGKNTYPGVGISIGISRLLVPLLQAGRLDATREVPTCVLVALANEDERADANALAQRLRERGIPAQVSPSAAKYGKQIKFADKRGIPFVLFPGEDGLQMKDIRSGAQVPAEVDSWEPPAEDLHPRVIAAD
jgi:histidyl-tRNA synthetase